MISKEMQCNYFNMDSAFLKSSVNIENIPILGREIEELQYEVEKF